MITIDYDVADSITRANLVDMLVGLDESIKENEKRLEEEGDDFPEHKAIDLLQDKRCKKSIENVLRYMSIASDLKQYGLSHLCDW
jgi:hypothetical protein